MSKDVKKVDEKELLKRIQGAGARSGRRKKDFNKKATSRALPAFVDLPIQKPQSDKRDANHYEQRYSSLLTICNLEIPVWQKRFHVSVNLAAPLMILCLFAFFIGPCIDYASAYELTLLGQVVFAFICTLPTIIAWLAYAELSDVREIRTKEIKKLAQLRAARLERLRGEASKGQGGNPCE